MYPKNGHNHVMRTVPYVYRVVRELATLYLRKPSRRFEGVGPETDALIAGVYRGAQVDRRLRHIHELGVATGNAPLLVFPMPATSGVRLVALPAHLHDVEMREALSNDERDIESWWVRLPIKRDPSTGLVLYGVAHITPDTATWVDGPLQGEGLWNDDGTNPLGEVPVVMFRGSDAEPGLFWAAAPEDLLDTQRAACHDYTDIGTIARLQGYGQGWVKGVSQAQAGEMEVGPEAFAALPDDGEMGFASPSPQIDAYRAQLKDYLRTVTAANGLNPASIDKSQGVTALAKIVEMADREVERRRHIVEFERVENRLYSLIRKWVNVQRGEVLPRARVAVEYREPWFPADPLHDAQAMQLRMELGVSSDVREIARIEGLTIEEATARREQYRAENVAPVRGEMVEPD